MALALAIHESCAKAIKTPLAASKNRLSDNLPVLT